MELTQKRDWLFGALKDKHKKDLDFENYDYGYFSSYYDWGKDYDVTVFLLNGFDVELDKEDLEYGIGSDKLEYRINGAWHTQHIESVFETFIKNGSMLVRQRFYQVEKRK